MDAVLKVLSLLIERDSYQISIEVFEEAALFKRAFSTPVMSNKSARITQVERVLAFLISEGFAERKKIEAHEDKGGYILTVPGLLFRMRGGFKRERLRKFRERRITRLIAIAAVVAAVLPSFVTFVRYIICHTPVLKSLLPWACWELK